MNYKETTFISIGDFIDIYYKVKFKGAQFLVSKLFKLSYKDRVSSKWDAFTSQSDFWIIPEIKKSWNFKISGDENLQYEDYVLQKYLWNKSGLNLLAIGCGEGRHERNFLKNNVFKNVVGVDISQESINNAKKEALKNGLDIDYFCEDFRKMDFQGEKFDVVLFDSSLHHFNNISDFLKTKVSPVLNDNGIVVAFEYCGPNRLQWRKSQLREANRILKTIPKSYKQLIDGTNTKKKVYRPGLIRMLFVDPSEAPDSENLVKALNDNFTTLEEKKLGWNILHILLKGISHNFLSDKKKAKELIRNLIREEEDFVQRSGENDAIFGVYRKKEV